MSPLQVSLGIPPYNETVYEDMILILEHLQQHVPGKTVERELPVPDQTSIRYSKQNYAGAITLVGSDQLTVARAHGAQ